MLDGDCGIERAQPGQTGSSGRVGGFAEGASPCGLGSIPQEAGASPGLPRIPKSLPERRARDSREAPGSGRGRGRGGGRKRPERRCVRPGPGKAGPASVSCRGCTPDPGGSRAPEHTAGRGRERRASRRKRREGGPGLSREERGLRLRRREGATPGNARAS